MYCITGQLRSQNKKLPEPERRRLIQEYFDLHKTVLTTYGSFRAYRIKQIDFDTSPRKNTFNLKEKNNIVKTVTIFDYYKAQYSITIKDPDQPLLIVERKSRGKKSNNKQSKENEETPVIYLVPELVYATGIDTGDKNNTSRSRNIIAKTKMDPNKKIEEIGKIRKLMENTEGKNYKGKDGNVYKSKSANEFSKEWGITLGDNLVIKGRVLPQPKLKYAKNSIVVPRNGNFRSGNICNGAQMPPLPQGARPLFRLCL